MRAIDADELKEQIRKGLGIKSFKHLLPAEKYIVEKIDRMPTIQPEYHEIGYRECADAVLKMWMDNVLTDGEHNRIIDKLNAKWAISEGDTE